MRMMGPLLLPRVLAVNVPTARIVIRSSYTWPSVHLDWRHPDQLQRRLCALR